MTKKNEGKLTADNLKNVLWDTLNKIRSGETDAKTANAIAGQARGIISTLNVELSIQNSVSKLTKKVRDFTD